MPPARTRNAILPTRCCPTEPESPPPAGRDGSGTSTPQKGQQREGKGSQEQSRAPSWRALVPRLPLTAAGPSWQKSTAEVPDGSAQGRAGATGHPAQPRAACARRSPRTSPRGRGEAERDALVPPQAAGGTLPVLAPLWSRAPRFACCQRRPQSPAWSPGACPAPAPAGASPRWHRKGFRVSPSRTEPAAGFLLPPPFPQKNFPKEAQERIFPSLDKNGQKNTRANDTGSL